MDSALLDRRVRRQHPTPEQARDGGFTLLEVLVSITLIGILMTALTTFFVTTVSATHSLGSRQAAAQLADDAIEFVRSADPTHLADGRLGGPANPSQLATVPGVQTYLTTMAELDKGNASTPTLPVPSTSPSASSNPSGVVTVNNLTYQRYWYLGTCTQAPTWKSGATGDCDTSAKNPAMTLYRVVVAVTWSDKTCPGNVCAYFTSTLVTTSTTDPQFNVNQSTVNNPGDQTGIVTVPITPVQMTASGGTAPLAWSSTSLPPGLSINASTGLISGTPTAPGTFSVTVAATDALNTVVGGVNFDWEIDVNPLTVGATPAAQSGEATAPITPVQVTATFGVPPYTWTATGLPTGLSIDAATGKVTGAPTTAGTYQVTLTVTDTQPKTASTGTFTWTVTPGPTLTAPTGNRSNVQGTAITAVTASATGGSGSYTWKRSVLPTGLSIDAATGTISGTPSSGTRWVVTVTVTDAKGGTASSTFVWTITPSSGKLQVTAPAGDRTGDTVGKSVSFSATASGGSGSGYIWSSSGLPPGVTMTNAGAVSGAPSTAGSYLVTLTVKDSASNTATFMFTWTVQ